MILADTSIWVDHFRRNEAGLEQLVQDDELVMHPYIIGELAMGQIKDRASAIADLNDLTQLLPVKHVDVMVMIEGKSLFGSGLQYVDAHLLASTLITTDCKLWTRDKRLKSAAQRLRIDAKLA